MIILVGTDFHGDEETFRRFTVKAEETKAEVLLIGGDITHFGSIQAAKDLLLILTELRLPIFFVPGNCDPPSLVGVDIEGAVCIHGTHQTYGDVTFIGVGGSNFSPFGTPFEMSDEEIGEVLKRSVKRCLLTPKCILVSHTPPKDTAADKLYSGKHVGSISVRRFIEEEKPSIVFCGHIHEAKGTDRIGETIVVNPGSARHGNCAITILNDDIEVILDYL